MRRHLIVAFALITLSLVGLKVNLRVESGGTIKTQSFVLTVPARTTVQRLLEIAQKYKHISFTAKTYKGLGVLIESINGIKNGRNGYWTYSVNGVFAHVGAGGYLLKNKDTVLWRYAR